MSQITTSLSERRRKDKAAKLGKHIQLKFEDVHKSADVLCIGLPDHLGEVVTIASPEGRAAVGKIFPKANIAWRDIREASSAFPADWLEFNFVLPALIDARHELGAQLPEHLLKLKKVSDMNEDHFACLLMFAATAQGVRAALFSQDKQKITINIPNNCNN